MKHVHSVEDLIKLSHYTAECQKRSKMASNLVRPVKTWRQSFGLCYLNNLQNIFWTNTKIYIKYSAELVSFINMPIMAAWYELYEVLLNHQIIHYLGQILNCNSILAVHTSCCQDTCYILLMGQGICAKKKMDRSFGRNLIPKQESSRPIGRQTSYISPTPRPLIWCQWAVKHQSKTNKAYTIAKITRQVGCKLNWTIYQLFVDCPTVVWIIIFWVDIKCFWWKNA